MGNSQTPSRAELQRRRQQSARDRRQHEHEQEQLRRQQPARDRERNRRQQAQTFCWSSPRLRQEIVTSVAATLEAMPPALPWKSDSDSGPGFDSEKYSDATLYLGESNTPFPAHQMVLGMCSPYFDDALQSKFKEGITKEFYFKKDSPHALWRVLQYMYTGDYADEESEPLGS
ncbi:uncharacterized protein BP5553_06878 [Venustampulla echinocandica]|uniref:BTB domain-containing protein n=1 Tax=Venustampulla echinocandica TaxID=2656787 RepID=A0A370TL56_9HELO|nr:uncharacterized protein BP5553_06878 [Venustampulla echinocandica]RDL36266.1 hypothetical protein BP5553_06878 [Venustampulla echinocandica]